MPDEELAYVPALELAAMVRKRVISPSELVEGFLSRIAALDPALGAFITVAGESARTEAERAGELLATEADHASLPPFLGVPVAIKDFVDTAGLRTTCGAAAWAERVPERDAAVVAKLRAAGFVVIGKTNLPELAGGCYVENEHYGPCRNPWDLRRSCGGSSNGTAVAVAAGLAPCGHGTDDGGSVRIPAGYAGLVGIKPSRGRVSAAPEPQAMEHTSGPITRTVADAAAMLDAMSGYVTGDAFWAPPPARPFAAEVGEPPGTLRIAVVTRGADHVPVEPDHVAAVERTAAVLSGHGHEVTEVIDWPGRGTFPDDRIMPLHEMYGAMWAGMASIGLIPPADQLVAANRALVDAGGRARAGDLLMASRLAQMTARQVVGFFEDQGIDVMLTPVMACRAPLLGSLTDDDEALARYRAAVQFTAQFNVTGQPAMAVPSGLDGRGLPVGIQLVGRPTGEATLIRLASQLEVAQPWAHLRPPPPGADTPPSTAV